MRMRLPGYSELQGRIMDVAVLLGLRNELARCSMECMWKGVGYCFLIVAWVCMFRVVGKYTQLNCVADVSCVAPGCEANNLFCRIHDASNLSVQNKCKVVFPR